MTYTNTHKKFWYTMRYYKKKKKKDWKAWSWKRFHENENKKGERQIAGGRNVGKKVYFTSHESQMVKDYFIIIQKNIS